MLIDNLKHDVNLTQNFTLKLRYINLGSRVKGDGELYQSLVCIEPPVLTHVGLLHILRLRLLYQNETCMSLFYIFKPTLDQVSLVRELTSSRIYLCPQLRNTQCLIHEEIWIVIPVVGTAVHWIRTDGVLSLDKAKNVVEDRSTMRSLDIP